VTASVDAVRASIDRRAARARQLAASDASTSELLAFYAALLDEQRCWLDACASVIRGGFDDVPPRERLRHALDTDDLVTVARRLVRWLACTGPEALRMAAAKLMADGDPVWRDHVDASLAPTAPAPSDPVVAFVREAVVQPFAEVALQQRVTAPGDGEAVATDTRTCPSCGDRPVVGVLRERGHGASRAFVCGRCAGEWVAPRIVCPACGGMDVERLPVFRADAWPAARLDACEACRTYVKSFDLSVDGNAIAMVDDVATVALDLWAAEQGFTRVRRHLLQF
jgi:formate dehydrogenase accessory protein FdhE